MSEKVCLKDFAEPIARMLYGTITVLALIVAMSRKLMSSGEGLLTLGLASLVLVCTHAYMYIVKHALKTGRLTTLREKWIITRSLFWLTVPAAVPSFFFVLAYLGVISDSHIFDFSAWTLISMMFFSGFFAQLMMSSRWFQSLIAGLAVSGLGVLSVVAKTYLK